MNRNHPANTVIKKGNYLEGKNIWLGVTGSVSCVESVSLCRELLRYGAKVTIVANRSALELVGEKALEFACGKPIVNEITGQVEHVIAGHEADLLMIAPCCATSIGKMVNGIGDNPPMLVALTSIGAKIPIMIAPAMDSNMAKSKIVQRNIAKIKKFATVIKPNMIEGKAKMPSKERLVAEACKICGPKELTKKQILVIGGSSSEDVDDVRVISNKSSGLMAVSLSDCAFALGANIDLWLGNSQFKPGNWINTTRFTTLSDLKKLITKMRKYDAIIIPAALSDFIPKKTKGKLNSSKPVNLEMKKAPKIIDSVSKKHNGLLYAFKLGAKISDQELVEKAQSLLKNADCVIANHSEVMGSDKGKFALVNKKKTEWITTKKDTLSRKILEKIALELKTK